MDLSHQTKPHAFLVQLWKYGLVSALALAVDYGLLLLLTELASLHYLASGTIGFCCGAVVAYTLSILFVFNERRFSSPALEFTLFVLIGVAALALNQALLFALVGGVGLHYAMAKIPVAGAVFLFNFAVRRALLFSAAPQPVRP